jgi:hypothetical protein
VSCRPINPADRAAPKATWKIRSGRCSTITTWETAHVWDLKTGPDVITNSWAKAVSERLDPAKTPETIGHKLAEEANCPGSTLVKVSA